jgi:PAS domain S-box-containing protein
VQAEKSLQNSEERYRNLVENMDDMVYTLDIEGRLTYVSPAVEQISGYAPEELTGRHFGEFVHPGDLPAAAANFGIAEENQSVHLELRILSKDGSVINVRSSGRPLFERGERIGVSGILSNITEQVKAETERDEQRRMLRAVLDTLSDFIIFKDKESVFRVCNQAFCDFMGLPEEEIMGKTDFDLFPPENAQSYRDEELQVMESEQTAINIHRLEGPDGIHWDEAIKTPLRNEQGEIIGVLTAGRDITDRMQAEAERDEQQRMLRALLDATPDFVIFKDRESVFRACSERHRQSLGPDTPMDQYLGQSDVDIFPEEEAQRYREEEVHVMETGKHLMAEHLLETSDGPCWVEAVKMPLRNEQGEIVGVFSCERDITEPKQYEGSLARRAREMTALYETSLEINAQQDVPTLLTDIIRRAADLVGVTTGGTLPNEARW